MNVRDRERWDWANMPEFPSPRRADSFRERLKLVELKKRRAKGPKNHSTNRERSYADRAKHARMQKQMRETYDTMHAWKEAVRAYWRGDRDEHP